MMLSNRSNFAGAAWQPYDGALLPWTLIAGDGNWTVYAALKDWAGNVAQGTTTLDATITVDSTPPAAPIFTLAGGAYTNNRTVTVNFSNPTPGETVLFESNRALGQIQEQGAANSLDFTLPDVDGLHILTLRYRDGAGNVSDASSASITLDRGAPSILSFAVEGNGYTKSGSVVLLVEAEGASEMRFGNDGTTWASWEAYRTRRQGWLINTTGNGEKSVYLQVRDLAGNVTTCASPANVYYDTEPPGGALTLAGGQDPVNSRSISVAISGTPADTVSMAIGDAALDCLNAAYGSFTPATTYTLPIANASNTVAVCLKDYASNYARISRAITHDDVRPQIAVAVPERTNDADGTVTVQVTVSGETDVVEIALTSQYATPVNFNITPSVNSTGSAAIALTPATGGAPDGSLLLTIEARDRAANVTTANRIVLVDRIRPVFDRLGCATCLASGTSYLSTSTSATLEVAASGASEMRITGNITSSTSWQAYANLVAITLAPGDGSKSLSVELRDNAGNLSNPTLRTIAILLDTPTGGKPTIGTVTVTGSDKDGPSTLRTRNSRVTVATAGFADNSGGSGLTQYLMSEDSAFSGATWRDCPAGSGCNFVSDWTLSATDANKTVYFKVRDAALNASDTASNATPILLDTTAPTLSVVLEGTVADTTKSTVFTRLSTIDIRPTAADSGSGLSPATALMQVSERSDFSGASWEALANPRVYTFGVGDGLRRVYVRVRDLAGNERVGDASITLDTQAPALGAVYFSQGSITTSTSATLNIVASGATEMRLTGSLTAPSPGSWVVYAPSVVVTLSSAEGSKTVTVELRDIAGNPSSPESANATILLDSTTGGVPTAGTVTVLGLDKDGSSSLWTRTRNVTVRTAGFADNTYGSGLTQIMVSESAVFTGAAWQNCPIGLSCNFDIPWTLSSSDGDKTIYVKVRDAAGNESAAVSGPVIKLDTLPPLLTAELIGRVGALGTSTLFTSASEVTVHLVAADTGSGLSPADGLLMVSNDASFSGAIWQDLGDVGNFLLKDPLVDGDKRVFVRVQDLAGNYSTVDSSILLDTRPPTDNSIDIDSGATYVNGYASHELTLRSTDKGSGVYQMKLSNASTGGVWELYSPEITGWDLTTGSGARYVYVWFRDAAGNESRSFRDRVFLDSQAPSGVSFTVEAKPDDYSGACAVSSEHWVYSTDLYINVYGTDDLGIAEYKIAEAGNFGAVDWRTWPGDSETVSFLISSTPGEKTLSMRVRDHVDNEVDAATVCVTLDSSPPSVESMVMMSNSACTTPVITTCNSPSHGTVPCTSASNFYLLVNADPGAGGATLDGLAFTDNVDISSVYTNSRYYYNSEVASSYHYYNTLRYMMPFNACVRVYIDTANAWDELFTGQVRNSYGAWSAAGSLAFVYDATPPSSPVLGYVETGSRSLTAYWSAASDAESGISEYRVYYSLDPTVNTSDPYVSVAASETSANIAGLVNRRMYWVNVAAVNGTGTLSTLVASDTKQVAVGYKLTQVLSSGVPVIPVDLEVADGSIYVLYLQLQGGAWDDPSSTLHLARSDDWGESWVKTTVDATAAENREDADIAMVDGSLYVASLGDSSGSTNDDLNIWVSADRGSSWILEQSFAGAGVTSHGIGMAKEGGGLSIVYTRDVGSGDLDVYITKRSLDRATQDPWTTPAALYTSSTYCGRRWRACANNSTLNTMSQGSSSYSYNLTSYTHGSTVGDTNSFTGQSGDLACSAYGIGQVFGVMRSDDDLFIEYSTNDGSTWSSPTSIRSNSVDVDSDPAIWVSERADGHNIFVAYREINTGAIWIGESFNPTTGYTWTRVDASGLGGVNMIMDGDGVEDVALVYADVEGLSISLVTVALPAPVVHPTVARNLSGLSWGDLGVDRYLVSSGAAAGELTTALQTPANSVTWTDNAEEPYAMVQALSPLETTGTVGHIHQVSGFEEVTVSSGTVTSKGSHFTRLVADGNVVVLLPPLGWDDSALTDSQDDDVGVYQSADGGATFTWRSVRAMNDLWPARYYSMAYSKGTLHLVSTDDRASASDENLFYARSTNGGVSWSYVTIDSMVGHHQWIDIGTSAAVNPNGYYTIVPVYVAYNESTNQTYLAFKCSENSGSAWTSVGTTRWVNLGALSDIDDRPAAVSVGHVSNELCSAVDIHVAYVRVSPSTTMPTPCYVYTTDGGTSWSAEQCDLGDTDLLYTLSYSALLDYTYEGTDNENVELLLSTASISGAQTPWYASTGLHTSNKSGYRTQTLEAENILGSSLDGANIARVRNSDGMTVVHTTTFNFLGISKHALKLCYCHDNCHGPESWERRTIKVQNTPETADLSAVSLGIDETTHRIYVGYQMSTGTDSLRVLRGGIMRRAR
ncbi:MAG: fibronectin type III domain-containing protein [Deltaproteobacteria bacterium]|nr:fibronectin type III domain-containing protein [Deltaproteobacteria bacterium]